MDANERAAYTGIEGWAAHARFDGRGAGLALDSARRRRYVRLPARPGMEDAMSPHATIRSYLIFTGTGPILVLSTYPELTDARLVEKLAYKGISKFIAYEVSLAAVRERYALAFEGVARDLDEVEDIRVLDFNGHQIMTNFSLDELGEPIKFGG